MLNETDGFLNVFKPQGITSFDVIRRIKPLLWKKAKIGHAGVVDKPAGGVLPIGLGRATKLFDVLSGYTKDYYAWLAFGADSPTLDFGSALSPGGAPQSESEAYKLAEKVQASLKNFTGSVLQVPPAFSNVKVEGKELYKYELGDEPVEVKPRRITIERISILDFLYVRGGKSERLMMPALINDTLEGKRGAENSGDETSGYALPELVYDLPEDYSAPLLFARIFMECETGTYVRALARDIGEAAGAVGVVAALVRTRVGPFVHTSSLELEEFAAALEKDRDAALAANIIPLASVVPKSAKLDVLLEEALRLSRGNYIVVQEHRLPAIAAANRQKAETVFAVLEDGRLAAECTVHEKNPQQGLWAIKPAKVYLS